MTSLAKASGLKEELARTSQLLVDGALARWGVITMSALFLPINPNAFGAFVTYPLINDSTPVECAKLHLCKTTSITWYRLVVSPGVRRSRLKRD